MPLTHPYSTTENLKPKSGPEKRIYQGERPEHDRKSIARLAYALWQERGCPPGNGLEDWLEAERELSELQVASAP